MSEIIPKHIQEHVDLMKNTYAYMLLDHIEKNNTDLIYKFLFTDFVDINLTIDNNCIIAAAYLNEDLKVLNYLFNNEEVNSLLKEKNLKLFDLINLKLTKYKLNHF